jgi:peptidoglycan hydrolase-like protein with peptidoglycan-binding domain
MVDGMNGPMTQAAIRAYQLDRGLPVTGRIDALLISDLGL